MLRTKMTVQTCLKVYSPNTVGSLHVSPLGDCPGARHVHDVGLDDDVEDPNGGLHRLRVELAHVRPCILQLGLGDVKHPLPPGLVVRDGDPFIVCDDVGANCLDGFAVCLDPAHSVALQSLECSRTFQTVELLT